jgi:hypothetical protein
MKVSGGILFLLPALCTSFSKNVVAEECPGVYNAQKLKGLPVSNDNWDLVYMLGGVCGLFALFIVVRLLQLLADWFCSCCTDSATGRQSSSHALLRPSMGTRINQVS